MTTIRILLVLFILCLGFALLMSFSAHGLILDHVLDGVKEIVGHEVQKIETKIDDFVMAEVAKVKYELIKAWVFQTITLIIYSTVLVFVVFYISKRNSK